jgi:iron complex transport system substrate-binding protein
MGLNTILAGIALCLLLLASPVAASDYTLEIFGNANEDDTINMQDVTYTELIILEYRDRTELADAKYDGEIDILDMTQIALIILGREKELTFLDTVDKIVTVKKPLKRVVLTHPFHVETLRTLEVSEDMIVGIAKQRWDEAFFPEFSDVPSVGWRWTPDIEAILNLHPDAVILFTKPDATSATLESADPNISLIHITHRNLPVYSEIVKKLGYIFDKEDEAEEFIDFYEECRNQISEEVEKLPEDDKLNVYFESGKKYSIHRKGAIQIRSAGGKDIFADQPAGGNVDPESVIERDPDVIVKVATTSVQWHYPGGYDIDADDIAELREVKEEIMSRPELQSVKAVKDGRVYVITVHLIDFYPVGGCRHFVANAYTAKWLYPDLFEELDPHAMHQEYLTRFQRLDIDLDEKGVFVYPPFEES